MAAEKTTRPRSCSRTKASRPGRIVGREIRAGDRHQPAAIGETRERRSDMAKRGVRHAAIDIGAIAEKGGFISTTLGATAASR